MMDDFRPRRPPERRDYSTPVRRPAHHVAHPQPSHPPVQQPHAHSIQSESGALASQPVYRPPATDHHHLDTAPATHSHQTAHHRVGLKYLAIAAALILAVGLFTAGYLFKSKTPDKTIPTAVVTKANFDVYFPSPMPAGYVYVSKTATFQIGDIFYRFADGLKSVTVREEPVPAKKPNLNLYTGYSQFSTNIGQVAMGTTFGEPTAVILTPTTVITMNTSGGVSAAALKTAIDNLRNIGSSSQAASNG